MVACAAGFTDGLGYGDNTKAAVIRLGLMEITKVSQFIGSVEKEYIEVLKNPFLMKVKTKLSNYMGYELHGTMRERMEIGDL